MGSHKKIKVGVVKAGARVQAPPPGRASSNDSRPIFNLEHLGGEYCLSRCTPEQRVAFVDRMLALSRMTWGAIQQQPRHGLGSEIIQRNQLSRTNYPPDLSDDVPILAFRFMGMAPFLGYRTDRMFTVLIVDPKMTAYKHN